MSLQDDLESTPQASTSILDQTLGKLKKEERDLLLEHLYGDTPASRISVALTNLGYPHDPKTIQRWRRVNGGE